VQVVGGEEGAVRDPVAPSERTVHPREQEAAEEQLLAEDGVEERENDDQREPGPVPAQERVAGMGVEERAHVAVGRIRHA
jgi:hypothetical protein